MLKSLTSLSPCVAQRTSKNSWRAKPRPSPKSKQGKADFSLYTYLTSQSSQSSQSPSQVSEILSLRSLQTYMNEAHATQGLKDQTDLKAQVIQDDSRWFK